MLKYLFFFIFASFLAHSSELKNIRTMQYKKNYPITIYLTIENDSEELDYLMGIDVLNEPNARAKIYKTVIDQGIVRIIKIDRLTVPGKSKVEFSPMGLFIVLEQIENKTIDLKFNFNSKNIFSKIIVIPFVKPKKIS